MTAMCSLVWLIGAEVTVKVTAGLSLSGWQLSEVLTVIILCSDVGYLGENIAIKPRDKGS